MPEPRIPKSVVHAFIGEAIVATLVLCLFAYVIVATRTVVNQNRELIQQTRDVIAARTAERKATDRRLCVYVRDHVVKPDRQSIEQSVRKSGPLLHALGFTPAQVKAYMKNAYAKGGIVERELRRRPIPNCLSGPPVEQPQQTTRPH
jgi:hypothetical protein